MQMQHLSRFAASLAPAVRTLCSTAAAPELVAAKPAIQRTSVLKNGEEVTVRRLDPREVRKLASFYDKPMQLSDVLAPKELSERAVRNHFSVQETPGEDALAALVRNRVVGATTIEAQPMDVEGPVDGRLLKQQGLSSSEVCIGRTLVDPEFRGMGVGRALKEAQCIAAANAGYKAVAGLTYSAALKHVVRTLGGSVQEGMGQTWTLVPSDAVR